jgi:hypothetical protein
MGRPVKSGPDLADYILERFARNDVDCRGDIIAAAREGVPYAREACRRLIEQMDTRGLRLPSELTVYQRDFMAGRIPPEVTWSGSRAADLMSRNLMAAIVVSALIDKFGLRPYSRLRKYISAAAIARDALREFAHIDIKLGAVEDAHNRIGRSIVGRPGAASDWPIEEIASG